ncbi:MULTISPECIES: hypothetical protein [Pandoraea]|uniref:Uncharacterized protein n=2 Tax=Pandoraea TaxID=93217 RepID=A0A5E4U2A5_9BURK|nr:MULTISPECIES: hypothetical protein [Pandoraea]ALS62782.1 hypothetical protein AT302_26230 [Pandoraea norimbergensis]VVD92249.1 hypothetical protein PIN31009_01688 [Pandoraea iniqua]VVD96421.1 hypothetical protein PIN31115_01870 [Pandoraea iniqua]
MFVAALTLLALAAALATGIAMVHLYASLPASMLEKAEKNGRFAYLAETTQAIESGKLVTKPATVVGQQALRL